MQDCTFSKFYNFRLALCLLAITLHAVIGQNYNYYNYENGGGEGNEGGQGGEHGSHRGDGMGGGRRGLKRAMIVKTIEVSLMLY